MSVKTIVDTVKDPGAAGREWVDGVIDRALERLSDWFAGAVDSLALGGMMVSCFLYMLGVRKGGPLTWGILAIWFTLKIIFLPIG